MRPKRIYKSFALRICIWRMPVNFRLTRRNIQLEFCHRTFHIPHHCAPRLVLRLSDDYEIAVGHIRARAETPRHIRRCFVALPVYQEHHDLIRLRFIHQFQTQPGTMTHGLFADPRARAPRRKNAKPILALFSHTLLALRTASLKTDDNPGHIDSFYHSVWFACGVAQSIFGLTSASTSPIVHPMAPSIISWKIGLVHVSSKLPMLV